MVRMLVIGDSHSRFWTGTNDLNRVESVIPGIKTVRLGAVTALGLSQPASPVWAAVESELAERKYDLVILSFGEVDIRAHVVQLALLRRTPIDLIIQDMVSSYFKFADLLYEKHQIPLLIWGPPPSRPNGGLAYNRAIPVVGLPAERNYATKLFNAHVEREVLERSGIAFATLFEALTDEDGVTRPAVLFDNCHIHSGLLPLALNVAAGAFKKLGLGELHAELVEAQPTAHGHAIDLVGQQPLIRDISQYILRLADEPQGSTALDLREAYVLSTIEVRPGFLQRITRITAGEPDRQVVLFEHGEAEPAALVKITSTKAVRFLQIEFDRCPAEELEFIEINVFTFVKQID